MTAPDTSWSKTLRLASVEDLPEVLRMYREMHQEHGMFPLNERRVVEMLSLHFAKNGHGILGVVPADGVKAPPGGKLKASIYLVLSNAYYSDEGQHYSDLWNWVDPNHRKERIAAELLKFARYVCQSSGLPGILTVLSNKRTEAKTRLYRRSFGAPADGATWVLNAPPSWKREPSNLNVWSQTEPQGTRVRGGRKHKASRREQAELNGSAHHG